MMPAGVLDSSSIGPVLSSDTSICIANIGIYEKSHDCAERVTAIVYNLMRNGAPFKRATEQINESLTKTAEKIYPINPQLVSSQYFSLEAARYCEKHFLGKTKEGDVMTQVMTLGPGPRTTRSRNTNSDITTSV